MDYGIIGTVAVCVIIAVIGIVSIRLTRNVKIDWVERQKLKDEKMRLKLKGICPHTLIEDFNKDTGKITLRSGFVKPPMSFYMTCEMCGFQTPNLDFPQEVLERWANNHNGLIERLKEHRKLTEKYFR